MPVLIGPQLTKLKAMGCIFYYVISIYTIIQRLDSSTWGLGLAGHDDGPKVDALKGRDFES